MRLTSLGAEFESVIAATFLFLAGGAISFLCCFFVTRTYLWHKRRMIRNKLRNEWSEDTSDTDIRITHRPHQQRSTRLLHKYQYNQQLKRVPMEVPAIDAEEKRPIAGAETSSTSNGSYNGNGGQKVWAQSTQGKIVIFECGGSGTEETNSS